MAAYNKLHRAKPPHQVNAPFPVLIPSLTLQFLHVERLHAELLDQLYQFVALCLVIHKHYVHHLVPHPIESSVHHIQNMKEIIETDRKPHL